MAGKVRRVAGACLLAASWLFLSGAAGSSTTFNQRLLEAHNRERAMLGVPPLRWNDSLAAGAKQWADFLARTRSFHHSPDDPGSAPVGENLWAGTVGAYQPEQMVGLWIAEKRFYHDGTFPAVSRTGAVEDVGHYTQLIWRSTRQVGCAVSDNTEEEVLVCRYSEAGNIIGETPV